MIGATSSGDSFSALGSYLERGKGDVPAEDRVAWVESGNLARDVDGSANAERAARIMEGTADLNPRCTQPCYHVSISFDRRDLPGGPSDPEARRVMLGVAEDTLRDLGLHEHQVVVVAHGDRDHPHLHMMVNRVHPETGRAWDRWQDQTRLEESLRRQERARGLREVPGQLGRLEGQERPPRGLSRGAHRAAMREAEQTGERPLLEEARSTLRWDFKGAESWDDLEGRLAEEGYVLRAKGRGLVVRDGRGREVKASAVHRDGGRGQLERRFGATWRAHRAGVEARTGTVPAGLSPHAEAAVRAERDRAAAAELHRETVRAAERVASARSSVQALGDQGREVRQAWKAVQDRLVGVYKGPAGAEHVLRKRVEAEGTRAASEILAQNPDWFGELRKARERRLGRPNENRARAAAVEAARAVDRYGRARRGLEAEKERAPRALREAKRAHGRATAVAAARPGESAAGRRLEGLAKALSPADRRALGRAVPEVGRAVEKAVERAVKRGLGRGLGIGF